MHWQDIVLAIGQILFILALIPAVKHLHKPPLTTSIMNGVVLLVFAAIYISLSLWFAAVTTAITGGMWFTLALQAFREKNSQKK